MGGPMRSTLSCPDVCIVLLSVAASCAKASGIGATFFSQPREYGMRHGSVHVSEDGSCQFRAGASADAVAHGSYICARKTSSNFGQFRVSTNGSYNDEQQMFAAGFVEGWMTAEQIYEYFRNTHDYFINDMKAELDEPMRWLEDQDRWVRKEVRRQGDSTYWRMLGLVLRHFDGLVAGYQARQAQRGSGLPLMTRRDFVFVNGNGELYDLLEAMEPPGAAQARYDSMSPPQLHAAVALSGRCSALVKVTADLSDILMGHSTWDTYTAMVKVFKHYEFALSLPGVAARRMSFSSYPGELFSDDDFLLEAYSPGPRSHLFSNFDLDTTWPTLQRASKYMMDSNLTILSTTNKNFNASVYAGLTPHSLVSWQRVRVANALARSGEEWTAMLDILNSGTYNNQYMVVDLGRFVPGGELVPGTLWVAEQLPGIIARADLTRELALGYWPSFNIPFFPEIYERSGLREFLAHTRARGPQYDATIRWLSYQLTPRAEIFRRRSGDVQDLAGLQTLMRSNDYMRDPLSRGDPLAAVCGRGDLGERAPAPHGCFDTKATSAARARALEAFAVNGPTVQGGLPAFEWTARWGNITHIGQPQRFDFEFELHSPANLQGHADS